MAESPVQPDPPARPLSLALLDRLVEQAQAQQRDELIVTPEAVTILKACAAEDETPPHG